MNTQTESLSSLRSRINGVDDKLLKILAQRVEISTEIGKHKFENGLPLVDPVRENEIISQLTEIGASLSLPETWIREIFQTILRGCVTISREKLGISAE